MAVKKCAWCGAPFHVTAAGWGYAYGAAYTCSYSCMRAMMREDLDPMTEEQKRQADELIWQGLSVRAAAEQMGVNPQNIYDYRKRAKKIPVKTEDAQPVQVITPKRPKPQAKPARAAPGQPDQEWRVEALRVLGQMVDLLDRLVGR